MTHFETNRSIDGKWEKAPDASSVLPLLRLSRGSMALFRLNAGNTSRAVRHRHVEEIWFVLEGRGVIWRNCEDKEEVTDLEPGVCLTLPQSTAFQFRADPKTDLLILGVTLPPWPGDDEAMPITGPWDAD